MPAAWRERWPLRRFGFHGLSHAWAARRAAELCGGAASRVVTCHLGAGASLAAVRDGRSVDTTMGFTPLEGLVMATPRATSTPASSSGWPSGSASTRSATRSSTPPAWPGWRARPTCARWWRADGGDEAALLALGVYGHRLRAGIAAMTAALGGLDAIVFTGGVGERSPRVRALAAEGMEHLGIALDAERNARAEPDAEIGPDGAAVRAFVVLAREDLVIAREVRALVAPA